MQVSRQRKDFVIKAARALVQTNSLLVYEDLQIRNMVKNHNLAKSISDASWSMFTNWIDYYVKVFGSHAVAVAHITQVRNVQGHALGDAPAFTGFFEGSAHLFQARFDHLLF